MTFSRSLAEHIARIHPEPLRVARLQLRLGHRLAPGELSRTGLYAIVSTRKGTILRVTLFAALAEEWRDVSRDIYECYVNIIDNASAGAKSVTSPRSSVGRAPGVMPLEAACSNRVVGSTHVEPRR